MSANQKSVQQQVAIAIEEKSKQETLISRETDMSRANGHSLPMTPPRVKMRSGSISNYRKNLEILLHGSSDDIADLLARMKLFEKSNDFHALDSKTQKKLQLELEQVKKYANPSNAKLLEQLRKHFTLWKRPSRLLMAFNENDHSVSELNPIHQREAPILNAEMMANLSQLRTQLTAILSPVKTKALKKHENHALDQKEIFEQQSSRAGATLEVTKGALQAQQQPIIETLKAEIAKKEQALQGLLKEREKILKDRETILQDLEDSRLNFAKVDKALRLQTAKAQDERLKNSALILKNAKLAVECDRMALQRMEAQKEKNRFQEQLYALQRELRINDSPHKIQIKSQMKSPDKVGTPAKK